MWQDECRLNEQKPVVIYKRGQCGNYSTDGLGFSQMQEVRWMKENGIAFAKFDIDKLEWLAECAEEGRDATKEYWAEVRRSGALRVCVPSPGLRALTSHQMNTA